MNEKIEEDVYCECGCDYQDNGEVCCCCGEYLTIDASSKWYGYDDEDEGDKMIEINTMDALHNKLDEYFPKGEEAIVVCNIDGDGLLMDIKDFVGNIDDTSSDVINTVTDWFNTFYEDLKDISGGVEEYAKNMKDGIRLYISKDGKEEMLKIDVAFIEYAKSR